MTQTPLHLLQRLFCTRQQTPSWVSPMVGSTCVTDNSPQHRVRPRLIVYAGGGPMELKSLVLGSLAGISMLVFSVATVLAQPPIVIKFSHVVSEDTPKGKGALKFKEL